MLEKRLSSARLSAKFARPMLDIPSVEFALTAIPWLERERKLISYLVPPTGLAQDIYGCNWHEINTANLISASVGY